MPCQSARILANPRAGSKRLFFWKGPLCPPRVAQGLCPLGGCENTVPDDAGLGKGGRTRVSAGSQGAGRTPGEAQPQVIGPQPWVCVSTTWGVKNNTNPHSRSRTPTPAQRRAQALACLKPPGLQWSAKLGGNSPIPPSPPNINSDSPSESLP